jgi:hypothetical protein
VIILSNVEEVRAFGEEDILENVLLSFEGDEESLVKNFEDIWGDDVYVAECEQDVKDFVKDSTEFDVCRFVDDSDWFVIIDINNNDGGPSLYIPRNLVDSFVLSLKE